MLQLHMKSYTFYVMEVHFMINKIKVLAADVDMTLSSKGSPLPEITIQALKELHDKNVKIGLATGREITEMEKTKGIFWNLGFEFDFVIGMNGGMIYDRNLNKSFTMDMLSVKEMKEVLTFLMPIIEESVRKRRRKSTSQCYEYQR